MKVHPVVYFLFKSTVRLALVLIFVGIPAASYYQRIHGIGFGTEEALGKALSSPTLDVSIGRLSINPFLGLVARDVRVRELGRDKQVLASIGQVVISISLGELIHRRIVVEGLSLRGTDASIPIPKSPDGRRVTIRDINAEIIVLGESLRVSSFEAVLEGIRFRISGEILNPFDFPVPEPSAPPDGSSQGGQIQKIQAMLADTLFPKGEPLVEAVIEIDARNPIGARVTDFSITCAAVQREGLFFSDIKVQGEFNDGRLRIPVIQIKDAHGLLQASGEWDRTTSLAQISMRGNLDPLPFLKLLAPTTPAGDLPVFGGAPQIELEATADFTKSGAALKLLGSFTSPSLTYKGVTFRDLSCGFAWADKRLHVRDLTLQGNRGALHAHLWIAPEDYRLQIQTTISPTDLSPLLDKPTREFLDKMQIADLPEITLSLHAPKLSFPFIKGTGHLKLGRTAMRGAWIDSGTADLEIGDSCVNYKNIVILTGPGKGTGSFAYDVGRQEVRLENIRSTLIPYDVMMWIDPNIARTISPYRFRSNPSVSVQGKVHMRLATKNNLSIQIESPTGMDYELLGKTLSFDRTSAKVLVEGSKVSALMTRAPLMGGDVTLAADVSIDPKTPFFTADVKLERVNFSKLTKLYFNYDDSKGVVSGKYSFKTRMGEEELMNGNGSIRIEDGNVFAIPVLGPFSSIIGAILPGVAYTTARLATADFTVANKKMNTKNIEIVGKGFSMFGSGDIYFLTGKLDMDMRLNAQGVPGIVFFPVSKLLEYHSDGTFTNPGWAPKIIPRLPVFGGPKKSESANP